jgi:hypothetical protein
VLGQSGAVALLEFLRAAARARIVAADFLQGVAHWLLGSVVAMRAVDVALGLVMVMCMVVIVVAVGAMDMGLLGHLCLLRNIIAGNYLTTAIQMQVMPEQKSGFQPAFQTIGDGLVGMLEQFCQFAQVLP